MRGHLAGRRTARLLAWGAATLLLIGGAAVGATGPSAAAGSTGAGIPGVHVAACASVPSLQISASPTSGTAPLSVAFTSNVTGGCGPFEFEWEFGDGGETGGANPIHVFGSAGNFPVQAQVQDSYGQTAQAFTSITVQGGGGAVQVVVQAAPSAPVDGQPVTLWANVTGGNISSTFTTAWAFGDYGHGSGTPVVHTYARNGTYHVSATVRDSLGHTGSGTLDLVVGRTSGGGTPNLTLDVSPESGGAPLNVTVLASSNGLATRDVLSVCYGDGTACDAGPVGWSGSTPFVFTHLFTAQGNFTVTSTLVNSTGSVVVGATASVEVTGASAVGVEGTAVPDAGTSPLDVSFVAAVNGGTAPYTVQWSFGDGAVGSSVPGEPVTHTYTLVGTFQPRVTVTDSAGHSANASLGEVVVRPVSTFAGLPGDYLGIPTSLLVGVALGGALAVGLMVGVVNRRRRRKELRKEGEQLVRELEQER